MRAKATMRDVAKLANVSQSTVSHVLSGAKEPIPIGEETQQRVHDAVEKLGYQRNLHAGSLRGQKTQMLAVMIADIANPFYHGIVRAIQDAAHAHNYDIMVANSDHMLDNEEHFFGSLIRRPVDGAILVPHHLTDDNLDELIDRTGVKLAVIGQHITHPQVDVAFGDDRRATDDMVSWFHSNKDHKRIGFIGVAEAFSSATRRRDAYEQAMNRARLEVPAGYEQFGDWSPESGYRAMQQLLALPLPPTAVFACNDLMAIGAMEAIHDAGLRIPEDVAIVGFDNIPAASWVRPRLSTVAQHPREMGAKLAQGLFERINGEYDGPSRRFEIPLSFIEREST